jgi:hypothetical protein
MGKKSLQILLFSILAPFRYFDGEMPKCFLNDLEKVEDEEKPQLRAISVAVFFENFRRRAAFSSLRRFVNAFTVSPVIAVKIRWK